MNKRKRAEKAASHLHEAWSNLVDANVELEAIGDTERAKEADELADKASDMEDKVRECLDPQNNG